MSHLCSQRRRAKRERRSRRISTSITAFPNQSELASCPYVAMQADALTIAAGAASAAAAATFLAAADRENVVEIEKTRVVVISDKSSAVTTLIVAH